MQPRTSYSFPLSKPQQAVLTGILRDGNYRPMQVEHAAIAGSTPGYNVVLYKSGKCVVQGREATDFVTFILEPMVLQAAGVGYEAELNPEASNPHMGVDESGKGDFFGPLVIVAAYTDPELTPIMREMDVKDSKSITSDSKALNMGRDLRKLLGNRFAVVKIGPEAYNRLYAKMRSVNTLLAWGHARAIENLLENVPSCPKAISDQFGSKEQVKRALMKKGRTVELVQRHRAESDPAVAAASVIAREIFLRSLYELSEKLGVRCAKGASPAVIEAGVELVRKRGPAILLQTTKCHFKTADDVLARAGLSRKDLGPEGQAVSRTGKFTYGSRSRKASAEGAAESPPAPAE